MRDFRSYLKEKQLLESSLPKGAIKTKNGYKFKPPKGAQNAAKQVLKWRDEHKDEVKAMTPTGWQRANQLANAELLSIDIVKRMAQFERHRKNAKISSEYKSTPWKDNGYVAWLGWGGDSGIEWAKRIAKWFKEK